MAKTEYDFALGEYVPKLDPLLEQMKREEGSLTLPISGGRMYMGPMMTPEEEKAFYASAPQTSIVRVAPQVGPPEGTAFTPTEEEELARIKQGDIPGFTEAISFRRNVPMPMPEEPGAMKFAGLAEYQRRVAAGVPREQAAADLGLDYLFRPAGIIDPYRAASLELRGREASLRERAIEQSGAAQMERFAQLRQKQESTPPLWLTKDYEAAIKEKTEAEGGLDEERKKRAAKVVEKYRADYPQYFKGPSATMPKVGEVRMGYRFKGGDPRVTSNWEIVGK